LNSKHHRADDPDTSRGRAVLLSLLLLVAAVLLLPIGLYLSLGLAVANTATQIYLIYSHGVRVYRLVLILVNSIMMAGILISLLIR
jgi:hypothetical protein